LFIWVSTRKSQQVSRQLVLLGLPFGFGDELLYPFLFRWGLRLKQPEFVNRIQDLAVIPAPLVGSPATRQCVSITFHVASEEKRGIPADKVCASSRESLARVRSARVVPDPELVPSRWIAALNSGNLTFQDIAVTAIANVAWRDRSAGRVCRASANNQGEK